MKKYLIAAFIFAISLSLFAQEEANPLIKNGDMEIWRDNKDFPNHWNSYYTTISEGIFSRSKDARSGKNALEVNFTPKKEHDNRRFFTFPVKLAQNKYTVTFHFKGKADIRFISLTKKGSDAGGKATDANLLGTPKLAEINARDWAPYSVTFDIAEAGDYQLFICLNSADKLRVDDVAMKIGDN